MNVKTSSNIQAPSAREIPNLNLQPAGVLDLELVDWNFSGAWCLELLLVVKSHA
jgi:hypothetical protein